MDDFDLSEPWFPKRNEQPLHLSWLWQRYLIQQEQTNAALCGHFGDGYYEIMTQRRLAKCRQHRQMMNLSESDDSDAECTGNRKSQGVSKFKNFLGHSRHHVMQKRINGFLYGSRFGQFLRYVGRKILYWMLRLLLWLLWSLCIGSVFLREKTRNIFWWISSFRSDNKLIWFDYNLLLYPLYFIFFTSLNYVQTKCKVFYIQLTQKMRSF